MLALTSKVAGPFNLGNGNGHSVKEVVDAAREVTGQPIPAETAPRRPGDPARLIAGAGRAIGTLGWKPKFSDIRAIIQSAWEWHRAHPNGYAKC
jgi:UDP-glucose 4-epimerase